MGFNNNNKSVSPISYPGKVRLDHIAFMMDRITGRFENLYQSMSDKNFCNF